MLILCSQTETTYQSKTTQWKLDILCCLKYLSIKWGGEEECLFQILPNGRGFYWRAYFKGGHWFMDLQNIETLSQTWSPKIFNELLMSLRRCDKAPPAMFDAHVSILPPSSFNLKASKFDISPGNHWYIIFLECCRCFHFLNNFFFLFCWNYEKQTDAHLCYTCTCSGTFQSTFL